MNLNWTIVAAASATLVIGALAALQPPINSELGKRTSDLAAALTSAVITCLVLGLLLVIFGNPGSLGRLREVPLLYLIGGGLVGASFLGVSLIVVRYLGAGLTVALVIAAQLIVAAALDHFGVIGLDVVEASPIRLLGIAMLIAGTALMFIDR
jgi:transporter family-2 protein